MQKKVDKDFCRIGFVLVITQKTSCPAAFLVFFGAAWYDLEKEVARHEKTTAPRLERGVHYAKKFQEINRREKKKKR